MIKKDIEIMSKSFPEPKPLHENVKVELNLSNYATKSNLKKHQVLIRNTFLLNRFGYFKNKILRKYKKCKMI